MRLRVFTTTLFVLGIVLMFAYPWILKMKPPADALTPEKAKFTIMFAGYFGALFLLFISASIGSLLILRQARKEFREHALDNVRELIDGSLEDHKRQEDDESKEPEA